MSSLYPVVFTNGNFIITLMPIFKCLFGPKTVIHYGTVENAGLSDGTAGLQYGETIRRFSRARNIDWISC